MDERELKQNHSYIELIQFLQLEGVKALLSVRNGHINLHLDKEVKIPRYMLSIYMPGTGRIPVNVTYEEWQPTINDFEIVEPLVGVA